MAIFILSGVFCISDNITLNCQTYISLSVLLLHQSRDEKTFFIVIVLILSATILSVPINVKLMSICSNSYPIPDFTSFPSPNSLMHPQWIFVIPMCFPLIEMYKMRCKTAILWSIFFNLLRYCLLFFGGGSTCRALPASPRMRICLPRH